MFSTQWKLKLFLLFYENAETGLISYFMVNKIRNKNVRKKIFLSFHNFVNAKARLIVSYILFLFSVLKDVHCLSFFKKLKNVCLYAHTHLYYLPTLSDFSVMYIG